VLLFIYYQEINMFCVRGVCEKQNSPMKNFHPDARNELKSGKRTMRPNCGGKTWVKPTGPSKPNW